MREHNSFEHLGAQCSDGDFRSWFDVRSRRCASSSGISDTARRSATSLAISLVTLRGAAPPAPCPAPCLLRASAAAAAFPARHAATASASRAAAAASPASASVPQGRPDILLATSSNDL